MSIFDEMLSGRLNPELEAGLANVAGNSGPGGDPPERRPQPHVISVEETVGTGSDRGRITVRLAEPMDMSVRVWALQVGRRFTVFNREIFCGNPDHERSGMSDLTANNMFMVEFCEWVAEHWDCIAAEGGPQ